MLVDLETISRGRKGKWRKRRSVSNAMKKEVTVREFLKPKKGVRTHAEDN